MTDQVTARMVELITKSQKKMRQAQDRLENAQRELEAGQSAYASLQRALQIHKDDMGVDAVDESASSSGFRNLHKLGLTVRKAMLVHMYEAGGIMKNSPLYRALEQSGYPKSSQQASRNEFVRHPELFHPIETSIHNLTDRGIADAEKVIDDLRSIDEQERLIPSAERNGHVDQAVLRNSGEGARLVTD